MERVELRLKDSKAWLDAHPKYKMGYIVLVYAPFIVVFTLLKEAPTLVLARKSFFLAVVYVSLRDTTGWLVNLFTFFWYVQMNLVAKLRGEGELRTAGLFIHYGTVATFLSGVLVALVYAGIGRKLLALISFAYAEEVLDLGLTALYAWAAGLPAVVMQSPVTGALLGMHEFLRLVVVIFAWAAIATVISVVMVTVQVPCDDKPTVVSETYLCPGSKRFLLDVSIVGAVVLWLTAAHAVAMQYKVATTHGMFPEGIPRSAGGIKGAPAAIWTALRSSWSRDTAGVAVRSILNNTREFISLVVALRLGILSAALYSIFASVSAFSYNVPNLLSTGAMAEGSKQLGRGEVGIVLWCLRFFHAVGVVCGLVFACIVHFQRDSIVNAYSGDAVYAGFAELVQQTWPLFVAFQPVYALVAVLGPLLMTTQNYTFWGQVVAACFFLVFLPITLAAAYTGSAYLLLLAEVLYNVAHLALLLYKVTWVEMRKLAQLAAVPGRKTAAESDDIADGVKAGRLESAAPKLMPAADF